MKTVNYILAVPIYLTPVTDDHLVKNYLPGTIQLRTGIIGLLCKFRT